MLVNVEAVNIYRVLYSLDPDTHCSDFAMSLYNLSDRCSDLKCLDDALSASEEAVIMYRDLLHLALGRSMGRRSGVANDFL